MRIHIGKARPADVIALIVLCVFDGAIFLNVIDAITDSYRALALDRIAVWPYPAVVGVLAVVLSLKARSDPVFGRTHRESKRCAGCKYSLDGLPQVARCPECGREDARCVTELDSHGITVGFEVGLVRVMLAFAMFMLIAKAVLVEEYLLVYPSWHGWIEQDGWVRDLINGWAVLPTMAGTVSLWIWHLWRRLRIRDALALCGVMLVVAAARVVVADPVFWPREHASSTLTACLTLVLGPPAIEVFRWVWPRVHSARRFGTWRRGVYDRLVRPRGATGPERESPHPCESSSPTTTASTPRASGPSTPC